MVATSALVFLIVAVMPAQPGGCAGMVSGITMFVLVGSTVLSIAQVDMTVGIGLLLDTLLVRTFLMPSLVALLGRRFWWPCLIGNRFTALRTQRGGPPGSQTSANSATRRVRSDVSM